MTTFSYLKPFLLANLKAGLTPALLGEPGIGKTAFLESLATELKTKVFVLSVNQLAAKEDLTGARLVPTAQKTDYEQKFYPHQVIGNAIKYANDHTNEVPILFMDEFNRTESDVTSALFTMITERKIGNRPLPDNLRLCVAGNDSGNVQAIDDASTSRLVIYHAEPDLDTLLATTPLNPYVKSTLKDNPDLPLIEHEAETKPDDDSSMEDFMAQIGNAKASFKQMTTPRTIENLSKELNALGIKGTDSVKDSTIMQNLAGDMNSLRQVLYGVSGKTDFTNKVIKTLTELITQSSSAKMNYNKPVLKHKLTVDDEKMISQIFDTVSDNDDLVANIDKLTDSQLLTLFELLIAPDLTDSLIDHSINSRMQTVALHDIIDKISSSNINNKSYMKLVADYGAIGFNNNARLVMRDLNDSNPIKIMFSTFM